jgi:TonB family protein
MPVHRAAVASLLVALAASAPAIRPSWAEDLPSHDSSPPCTLVVSNDESLSGCWEIGGGSETGEFLAAVGEHEVVLMRAWRTKDPRGLFRVGRRAGGSGAEPEIESEDVDSPYHRRGKALQTLQRHFARTAAIDSMAVEIHSDSAAVTNRVIESRLWVARTVRGRAGTTERRIDRYTYRETWWKSGPWILVGFDEIGAASWSLAESKARDLGFPRRAPRESAAKAPAGEPFWTDCGCKEGASLGEYDQGPTPMEAYSFDLASPTEATGMVLLLACVDKTGRACWIRVGQGVPGLDGKAIEYLRTWRFRPARLKGGAPAASWIQIPIMYH